MNILAKINGKRLQIMLIRHIHDTTLSNLIKKHISTGRLIDIGCGTKPYKDLLAPYVTEHIGVDHQNTLHDKSNIDRFGTAYRLPAKDGELDCALCL